jgi:hypothetical protein
MQAFYTLIVSVIVSNYWYVEETQASADATGQPRLRALLIASAHRPHILIVRVED